MSGFGTLSACSSRSLNWATSRGVHSATRLDQIFGEVISALQVDQDIMPDALLAALQAVTSTPLEPSASYAQGAIIAFEFRERWQRLFMAGPSSGRLKVA